MDHMGPYGPIWVTRRLVLSCGLKQHGLESRLRMQFRKWGFVVLGIRSQVKHESALDSNATGQPKTIELNVAELTSGRQHAYEGRRCTMPDV